MSGVRREWFVALVFAASLAALPQVASAEASPEAPEEAIHLSPPPVGAKTHTVVPAERYAAGGFKKWLFGGDYRYLWTMPIEIPVLDLDEVGGGLTPLRTGGFGQSFSLHFTAKNGQRYTVRSLDKDPTRRLMKLLKETFIKDIIQDQISSLHPTAALVVDPLLEATGVLHSNPELVIIPDDPRLGKYRNFAGLIGMLEVHQSEGPDGTPGFAGSRKVSSSEKMYEHREKGPHNRVDTRAFLKAKLMDFLIGDRDRHMGQWRWARFPEGEGYVWKPVPEDRDQAFINYDGLLLALSRIGIPGSIKFEGKYPNIVGLTFNGWEIDRELLSELEKPVWDETVQTIQAELTDQVIEDAVRRLPAKHYAMTGEFLTAALKSRRDRLQEVSDEYYKLITRWVDITATDEDEFVELDHKANGDLEVRITVEGAEAPYFRRTFHADETKEVRLYLHGGEDRTVVLGESGKITVRVDGGGGDDSYVNSSQTGAGKVRFYDSRGDNRFDRGNGARVDEERFDRPTSQSLVHKHALDWGGNAITLPLLTVSPDLGAYGGFLSRRVHFGYRKVPFSSRHTISAGLATEGPEPFVAYTGLFRQSVSDTDVQLHLEFSGINVIRFHGFGNDTEIPEETSFYEVDQKEFIFAPALVFRAGVNHGGKEGAGSETLRTTFTATVGPIVKYADTPSDDNEDHFIGTFDSDLYGTGSFGQVGARALLEYDTRDNPGHAKRGVYLQTSGTIYPETWDVEDTFGNVEGTASAFLTASMPTEPTLALRVGAQKVFGTVPFHEAAYLGGAANLRGYREDRFGGEGSAFGNAEFRFGLFDVKVLLPGRLGLFAAADVGRVFLDEDPDGADDWHTGLGGGLWLSFIDRLATLSVAVMDGDDLTGVYLRAGFMY